VIRGVGKSDRTTLSLGFVALAMLVFSLFLDAERSRKSADVNLTLSIQQNLVLAGETHYGEPGQVAIWLEDPATGVPQTVYVTRRAARGDWKDKFECPNALPVWFKVFRREHGRSGLPTLKTPAPDAVTHATTHEDTIRVTTTIPRNAKRVLWIEANLSSDFNEAFPRLRDDGTEDLHLDGQPAVLYRAEFAAVSDTVVEPTLWGRAVHDTDRGETTHDMTGISTAGGILTGMKLTLE
jgi:hypothetical protein